MSRINWSVSSPSASVPSSTAPGAATWFAPAAGGFTVAGPWASIYRLAYQQALAAREPSRFQKMMEPCWN
ncbi:hypothetical protein [Planctomyces sp. SH-PL62]|uniref:hypothetical protein n=1 Tax=Planctomyces sp. SH-PL62 TaxID=1636152 RepID=UPI00078C43AB|nr:hypothetical protein [Planctomyces sp. SH-PL62]AMV37731.1 hypothetical protein VT85_09865 [Planctomyces sp. SH-PL62]